jgi:hypothetical protein
MPVKEQQVTTTTCPTWCENHAAGEPADAPCVGEIDFSGGYRLLVFLLPCQRPEIELSGPEGVTQDAGCISLSAAPAGLPAKVAELLAV